LQHVSLIARCTKCPKKFQVSGPEGKELKIIGAVVRATASGCSFDHEEIRRFTLSNVSSLYKHQQCCNTSAWEKMDEQ
jgi:hypothetical protein